MARIDTRHRTYHCHRAESAAGFRNGDGVLKRRQDWTVGAVVNVSFLRGLTVISAPNGRDEHYTLQAVSGARYGFEPHAGIHRLADAA